MAIEEVHDYLSRHGPRRAKRWYDASVIADDLRYFLNVLDTADDDYRTLFLERVNALPRRRRPRAPIAGSRASDA